MVADILLDLKNLYNMKDYTIVIQGLLDQYSIDGISNYEKYGDILISTWDYTDTSKVPEHIKCVKENQPNRDNAIGVFTNVYYAISGMQNALENVKTKYVVRTRGDEVYFNLDPLIKKFEEDDNKFVCGNIFARSWDDHPFHIGDHLYVAKTDILKRGIDKLKRMWEKKDPLESWGVEGKGGEDWEPSNNGEGVLARSFLYGSGLEIKKWRNKNEFLKHFEVVDINLTEKFIASYQTNPNGPIKYIDNFQNPHNVKNTEDM